MNCHYTDEELKEDVEHTIGIRAKDIEKIQFCGLWHIRFRAFGTDFYYYRADSDDRCRQDLCAKLFAGSG